MKEPRKAYGAAAIVILVAQSLLARQQPAPNKQPVDPAERPKVRAMIEALNQRARELGSYQFLMTPTRLHSYAGDRTLS